LAEINFSVVVMQQVAAIYAASSRHDKDYKHDHWRRQEILIVRGGAVALGSLI